MMGNGVSQEIHNDSSSNSDGVIVFPVDYCIYDARKVGFWWRTLVENKDFLIFFNLILYNFIWILCKEMKYITVIPV